MNNNLESHCEIYLKSNPFTSDVLDKIIISGEKVVSGDELVNKHFNPMIEFLYKKIEQKVDASNLSIMEASFFIGELSVFARYNSTFLLRASETIRAYCPELSHELLRNFLEEGGERGKLPAHYVIYSGALLNDLGVRVNGWIPRAHTTLALTSIIDVLSWSHCPSTILGMYYAVEAVAISETEMLKSLTERIAFLKSINIAEQGNLNFYYEMHLDELHEAASDGLSVELGHQEGIAYFIRNSEQFNFSQPQIVDGFLQMLNLFVEQWMEVSALLKK